MNEWGWISREELTRRPFGLVNQESAESDFWKTLKSMRAADDTQMLEQSLYSEQQVKALSE